jgi:hypothetical protein
LKVAAAAAAAELSCLPRGGGVSNDIRFIIAMDQQRSFDSRRKWNRLMLMILRVEVEATRSE